MEKTIIHTEQAPRAIGAYSQAVKVGSTVYISGQIPLDPATMSLAGDDFAAQTTQVFKNLQAIIKAAGGTFKNVVKMTIYLTDMNDFATVNEIMSQFVQQPYPARAAVQVTALPKSALVEIDAILEL